MVQRLGKDTPMVWDVSSCELQTVEHAEDVREHAVTYVAHTRLGHSKHPCVLMKETSNPKSTTAI